MCSSSPTVDWDRVSDIPTPTDTKLTGISSLSDTQAHSFLSDGDSQPEDLKEVCNEDVQECEGAGRDSTDLYPYQKCAAAPATKLQRTHRIISDYWIWEMIACFFSLMGALTAFVLLLYENGTELGNWNWFLAPNVIVSYIGSLIKISIVMVLSVILSQLKWIHFKVANPLGHLRVFDNASRGPFGSAMLLWSSRRWLASIAAILMICSLLVDPFFQLALTFQTISTVDESQRSYFLSSNIFDPNIDDKGFAARYHGEARYTIYSNANKEMMKAIDHGLSSSSSFVNTTCPTGNCHWPQPITMLGVCGKCDNLTASIKYNCSQTPSPPQDWQFHPNFMAWDQTYDSEIPVISRPWLKGNVNKKCDYSFPTLAASNQTLTLSGRGRRTQDGSFDNMKNLLWYSSMDESVKSRSDDRAYIIRFFALQSTEMEPDDTDFPNVRAWACELAWCAKTLRNVTVSRGNRVFTPVDENLLYHHHSSLDFGLQELYPKYDLLGADQKFFVADRGAKALQDQLGMTFSVSYGPKTALSMDQPGNDGLMGDTLITKQVATSQDLDRTIKKLASSLTDMVRTSRHNKAILGNTMVIKTIIRVCWGWLVLPIVLPILTSILLAIVAVRSHTKKVILWKDDPLALLCHRIDDADLTSLDEGKAGPRALDCISKHLFVELSSTERLTLVKTNETARKALPWWKTGRGKEDLSRISRTETCIDV